MNDSPTGCVCDPEVFPHHCPLHNWDKSKSLVERCQTVPKWFLLWESGWRPGATAGKIQVKTAPDQGPGTELIGLLETFGIRSDDYPGCQCKLRASQMDMWGADGCREHRAEIVGWLQEEANKLGWAGRIASAGIGWLVDEAIRRASQ